MRRSSSARDPTARGVKGRDRTAGKQGLNSNRGHVWRSAEVWQAVIEQLTWVRVQMSEGIGELGSHGDHTFSSHWMVEGETAGVFAPSAPWGELVCCL